VNRTPGSLFTADPDGFVRNTYLLKITNKEASGSAVQYQIDLDGLERAELLTTLVTVEPEGSRTIPLVVRVPNEAADRRTIPFTVRVAAPTGELLLPTTFKTGASIGGED
jgi:hypothetical protein